MSCSFFPATLYHTSLPPFIFSMGHGRGPFSLLKNPLFVKNKEEAKANNKVRQSPFCQQSLTCYLECYQYWGGIRCRWERRTGRQTLLLLLLRLLCEGWKKKLIDIYQPAAKDLLAALHIKGKRPLAAAHLCWIVIQEVEIQRAMLQSTHTYLTHTHAT